MFDFKRNLLLFVMMIVMISTGGGRAATEMIAEDKIPIFDVISGKTVMKEPVVKSENEWKKILSPIQYKVMRQEGTERPFSGDLHEGKGKGIYRCIGCGTDLFLSQTKYDSKTGWPSFWDVAAHENVGTKTDFRLWTPRTEVHCNRCGAHLGHVFDDGPKPTGKRYCINSAALTFYKTE